MSPRLVLVTALSLAAHASLRSGAAVGAGAHQRRRLLGDGGRFLGGRRFVRVRQHRLERDRVPAGHSGASQAAAAGRVHRRRPRAEFHLHHRPPAEDRVHRRHPPAESPAAPVLQGAGRDVGGSQRFHVATLRPCAAVRCWVGLDGARVIRRLRGRSRFRRAGARDAGFRSRSVEARPWLPVERRRRTRHRGHLSLALHGRAQSARRFRRRTVDSVGTPS